MANKQDVISIVAVLIALLVLKYNGKNETPYDTHTNTMRLSLVTTLAYALATYSTLPPIYAHVYHAFVLLFGSLSLASLASLLLPNSVRPFLYSLCVLFSAAQYWIKRRTPLPNYLPLQMPMRPPPPTAPWWIAFN